MKSKSVFKLVLLSLVLMSCGYDRARFECSDNPFVVNEIRKIDGNLSEYTTNEFADFTSSELITKKSSFIAKTGIYNVGDTVRLLPAIKK